jgi:hypothetical protein
MNHELTLPPLSLPADSEWWGTSSGLIELQIGRADALSGCHSGACDDDIEWLRRAPYIQAQLDALDEALVSDELKEYGAWDDLERADHEANLSRLLWIACGDIRDNIEENQP